MITVMYVKIQFRFKLFACVILACILSTPHVSHKHKLHWQFFCVVDVKLNNHDYIVFLLLSHI